MRTHCSCKKGEERVGACFCFQTKRRCTYLRFHGRQSSKLWGVFSVYSVPHSLVFYHGDLSSLLPTQRDCCKIHATTVASLMVINDEDHPETAHQEELGPCINRWNEQFRDLGIRILFNLQQQFFFFRWGL